MSRTHAAVSQSARSGAAFSSSKEREKTMGKTLKLLTRSMRAYPTSGAR